MVVRTDLSDEQIDRVFHALAAATRRDILRRAIEDEHSVSALAREYDMSFAAVQKHVAVLEEAGLIVKRAEGRERLVRADPAMIARARALLARYEELWRARIDRLDALLAVPEGAASVDPTERPAPGSTDARTTDTRRNDPRRTDTQGE
ncbi:MULTISPECIES: metalloregulator ArsR/SmtB family transcription factor [Microbacterium]|uniref:ArsR/SmtB family transcription factor n=1 Tax=Microbacterium TaxID=33882 RepID=UPI000D652FF3|nr:MULTISPECIES: metalloregulator ArsR/SmtB family transcription factor [Microbacterium]